MLFPVDDDGDSYVHAKISIIDDSFAHRLQLASTGMGFGLECDVAVRAVHQRRILYPQRSIAIKARSAQSLRLRARQRRRNRPALGRGLRPVKPRRENLFGLPSSIRAFDPRCRRVKPAA
ncbi:hypothetical protein PE067_14075 [Paracoccus sp. DMF-8]|uniref:hypothetical protein n=1 Tax=Paracoccus sp. DMF-8 TaxID=3019445 RepID=UPI0023E7FE40|nr:hypothetical protein [Paracoccus sp. DMF-8]MDF3607163.1 hypothetical protein [Paracoccus sp. DMF-8]